MADVIEVNFEVLENVARLFNDRADSTDIMLRDVRKRMEALESDGWIGRGADAFYAEMSDEVLPRVIRLRDSLREASETTRRIAQVLSDAEDQASGGWPEAPAFSGGGSGLIAGAISRAGGVPGLGSAIGRGFLQGGVKGAWGGLVDQLAGDGGTLWSGEASVRAALAEATFSGDYGTVRLSAVDASASADGSITWTDDGTFQAKANARAELALLKAQYDANFAGVDLKAEAALLAEVDATAEAQFDPKTGNMSAGVKVDAFAGGKLEGEASYGNEYGTATATGGVSYGVGATFDAKAGYQDGILSAKFEVGATLGLGAEVGFDVQVNVDEVKDSVVEMSRDAADWAGEKMDSIGEALGGFFGR